MKTKLFSESPWGLLILELSPDQSCNCPTSLLCHRLRLFTLGRQCLQARDQSTVPQIPQHSNSATTTLYILQLKVRHYRLRRWIKRYQVSAEFCPYQALVSVCCSSAAAGGKDVFQKLFPWILSVNHFLTSIFPFTSRSKSTPCLRLLFPQHGPANFKSCD